MSDSRKPLSPAVFRQIEVAKQEWEMTMDFVGEWQIFRWGEAWGIRNITLAGVIALHLTSDRIFFK